MSDKIAKRMIVDCLKIQVTPVTYKWLAGQVGIDPRKCRELVAEIVTDGECPIISSSDQINGGYFIARTPKDAEIAVQEGTARIANLQRRMTGLKQAVSVWFGQEKMFSDAKEKPSENGRQYLEQMKILLDSKKG